MSGTVSEEKAEVLRYPKCGEVVSATLRHGEPRGAYGVEGVDSLPLSLRQGIPHPLPPPPISLLLYGIPGVASAEQEHPLNSA